MKDLLLLISVLGVMIYGFWLMKRLDVFMETTIISEDENCEADGNK